MAKNSNFFLQILFVKIEHVFIISFNINFININASTSSDKDVATDQTVEEN